MDPKIILQLASMLVAGGAVYGGIKASLARMMKDIEKQEKGLEKCNARIDHHLETQHNRRRTDV